MTKNSLTLSADFENKFTVGAQPPSLRAASGDVGYGVIRQREARVGRPGLEWHGRCALERLGLRTAQVREDLAHHDRVVDQPNDAHRRLALGAFERVELKQLADQPRPGGLGAPRAGILGGAGHPAPAAGRGIVLVLLAETGKFRDSEIWQREKSDLDTPGIDTFHGNRQRVVVEQRKAVIASAARFSSVRIFYPAPAPPPFAPMGGATGLPLCSWLQ